MLLLDSCSLLFDSWDKIWPVAVQHGLSFFPQAGSFFWPLLHVVPELSRIEELSTLELQLKPQDLSFLG